MSIEAIERGVLYVVATPIGNLADLSPRAISVLKQVDLIAAEDTRHSALMLRHFGIDTPLVSLHDHNEEARCAPLVARLADGETLAVISDAGTPVISDPGFRLVRAASRAGIRVSPVPGPCALVAALSASALPCERFAFEGFLPSKREARRQHLEGLKTEPRTLVFYESSHRIAECLEDMAAALGGERPVVVARELTKLYETIHSASLGEMPDWLRAEPARSKGEFVIIVEGAREPAISSPEALRIYRILADELAPSQAARIAAAITGLRRNDLYKLGARGGSGEEGGTE